MSALERFEGDGALVRLERELALLDRQAEIMARSKLVPQAFREKPEDIKLVGLVTHSLEVPFNLQTLSQFYVVRPKKKLPNGEWVEDPEAGGRVGMMAQLQTALAARHGYRLRVVESNEEYATVAIRRPGENEEHRITFTMAQARRANLHKRNPNYESWPAEMLLARACTRAIKQYASEVTLGLGGGPVTIDEDLGEVPSDDEVAEPDVDDTVSAAPEERTAEEGGAGEPATERSGAPTTGPAPEPEGEAPRGGADNSSSGPLAGGDFPRDFAMACQGLGFDDDQRHAVVEYVTGGRTCTSKEIRADEVEPCYRALAKIRRGDLEFVEGPGGRPALAEAAR